MITEISSQNPMYYAKHDEITRLKVPNLLFIMIDGVGAEYTASNFQDSKKAILAMNYRVQAELKKQGVINDFFDTPFEVIWKPKNGEFNFHERNSWAWTFLLRQHDALTPPLFTAVQQSLLEKKTLLKISNLYLKSFNEGHALQTLHKGPYHVNNTAISKLVEYINLNRLVQNGPQHHLYFNDPSNTSENDLLTIIRRPVVSFSE